MTRETAKIKVEQLDNYLSHACQDYGERDHEAMMMAIKALEQEPQSFKWCTDCREYDQEKHCCHRYSKVIRDAVVEIEQEPILDKINKMKSEIADSLEFWDYSPNNNPLARDMLETLTNFWGDIKAETEE